jgi:WD40 repeat protein
MIPPTAVTAATTLGAPQSPPLQHKFQVPGYVIVRLIGSGGMGSVFEAEQEHPRRRVAIKLIRSGFASPQLLRRFVNEADVLGRLQNPGIAQIYQFGTTDSGGTGGVEAAVQPFFAMELISGTGDHAAPTICAYADLNRIDTRGRLELIARIADAVHHAHQKGVIHRDLKPGNILVDETGQPKILDFGIARLTDTDAQASTLQTDVGQLLGTLPYMSPEQARAEPDQIDVRSDVYSLGVIAYELLTGRLPIPIGKAAIYESVRIINEEMPPRLSSVSRTLRGDVETIVGKALEKDRERRYQSAVEFASDIRRHLRNEPITARPPTTRYQLTKFAQRNKSLMVGVLAVLAALIGGITATTWQAIRATRNATVAIQNQRVADQRLAGSLLQAGDSLIKSQDFSEARRNYREAWAMCETMGLPTIHAVTGLLCSYTAPPPLLGSDGGQASSHVFGADGSETFSVAFSPDGRTVASAHGDASIRLWDLRTVAEIRRYRGHTQTVQAISFSPDGQSLLSAGADGKLMLWDVGNGNAPRHVMHGHSAGVNAAAFSPDGRRALSCSVDHSVKLWDLSTGKQIRSFDGHTNVVYCVAFSPDGRRAASGSHDYTMRIWDIESGREVRRCETPGTIFMSIAFARDGRRVVGSNGDNTIKLWNVEDGSILQTFKGLNGAANCVLFSPDERAIISAGWDRTIRLWDVQSGRTLQTWSAHRQAVNSISLSPDGSMLVSGDAAGEIKLWTLNPTAEIPSFPDPAELRSIAFSPDGLCVVSGGDDGVVRVRDIETGNVLRSFTGHSDRVFSVVYSPDGTQILSGGWDDTVRLWDVESGRELKRFIGHEKDVWCVAFCPDGRQGLSCGADGTVRLWDLQSGESVRTFSKRNARVLYVAPSPDGRRALSAGDDNSIQLLDLQSGATLATWTGHKHFVRCVAFCPDGKHAVSGSFDKSLCVWDVERGTAVSTMTGHTGYVKAVAISPDGTKILSSSDDFRMILWDMATGAQLRTFGIHERSVNAVAFSPDGMRVLSASVDHTVRLLDLNRPLRYREFDDALPMAITALRRNPEDAAGLSFLGRWYAFRGKDDWAADALLKAEVAGAKTSHLLIARSLWRSQRLEEALREFELARNGQEASSAYLILCIEAVDRTRRENLPLKGKVPNATGDHLQSR